MKVIVAGGRDFVGTESDKAWLRSKFNQICVTEVVSGTARGADRFGEIVAEEANIPIKKFPANWKKYGKSAGFRRNETMAEYADGVILFPGGKGTDHMKRIAKKTLRFIIDKVEEENNKQKPLF